MTTSRANDAIPDLRMGNVIRSGYQTYPASIGLDTSDDRTASFHVAGSMTTTSLSSNSFQMMTDGMVRSRQVSMAESVPDTMLSDYKLRSRQVSQSGFLPRVQTGSMALSPPSFSQPTISILGNPSVSVDNTTTNSYCDSHSDGLKGLHSSSSDQNQPYNPWKHPLSLYAVAIFIAWVYIIIPVTTFWEFALVKEGYYLIIVLICVNEFLDFCVPDALPITYVSTYVISFLTVLLIRLTQGFLNLADNSTINAEYILSPTIIVNCMYALDVFVYNVKAEKELFPERLTLGMEVEIQGVENPLRESLKEGKFEDQKMSESSTNPVGSIWKRLLESSPQSNQPVEPTRPKCALFDLFSISGCGAYSHVGRKMEHQDLPSRSAPRLAFLRVERQHHQVVVSIASTTVTDEEASKTRKYHYWVIESMVPVLLGCLPRSRYDRHLLNSRYYSVKKPVVLGSRKRLWLFGALCTCILGAQYSFLIYYVSLFRSLSQNGCSDGTLIGLFFVFVIVCTIFRVIVKRMGMECDKLKMNTASMFFLVEFFCLCFYYNFYRVLFESIPNWPTFLALEACHLFFEWVNYPLRASEGFNKAVADLCQNQSIDRRVREVLEGLFFPYGLDFVDWQYFVALDFGMRCFVIVESGITFVVDILSVSYLPWVKNALAQDSSSLTFTMEMMVVSVAMETVNALIINHLFFRKKNLNVLRVVIDCFQDNRFAFASTFFCANLIAITMIPFDDYSM